MSLPLNFPPDDLLPPSEHLGEQGQRLVEALLPAMPSGLYARAGLARLLRAAAYHDRWQGLAFRVAGHTLWAHLLNACGLPDTAKDTLAQAEARLLTLVTSPTWTFLAQPPVLRGPQANPVLAVAADLAPTPVYPLIGAAVQRVLLRALAQWGWPVTRLPKGLLNPLSALRRVAPTFQGALLMRFADALQSGNEDALVAAVWAACGQLRRLDGSDASLSPATRRRYYYEFITWALGLRRITPPEGKETPPAASVPRRSAVHTGESQPPRNLPRPGQRPPPPPPAWDDEDDPPEEQAADGYRSAAYRRAANRTRRDTAPQDAWLDALLPSSEEGGVNLPPWLLPESRMILERTPHLWDWHALTPDGWGTVVRHTLRRRDHTALVLLTAALTGRPLDWLADATRCDPHHLPDIGAPPAYDPASHTLVYRPGVWAYLPQRPEPADMFLPVADTWRLPLPSFLAERWQAMAEHTPPGQRLFARTLSAQATAMLARVGRRWLARHPADAPFTPGRLRRTWANLMQVLGDLDPLLTGWLSGLWPAGHYPPLFYTTLSLPWLASRFENALAQVGQSLGLPLASPRPRPRPLLLMGSVYHPRLSVVQRAVRALTQAVRGAATEAKRLNALTLLALYGLALFLGLRIGEAGRLRYGQFDLEATWQGEALPWLTLTGAKGNRFTTAARLVPLPPPLLPALQALLEATPDKALGAPAFGFHTSRGWTPATPDALRARLAALEVPVPRWHAGRHLLRSFLLRYGMAHEGINLILGHQAAGEEAWNPYRTVDIGAHFRAYRRLSITLARLLRWPEGIGAPTGGMDG